MVTFDIGSATCVFRVGQTVFLSNNASASSSYKGIVTECPVSGDATRFKVAFYNAGGILAGDTGATFTAFVYGSEFKKGANGMSGSLEAEDSFFVAFSPLGIYWEWKSRTSACYVCANCDC